ncbi:MAG: glycosyltransferase family 39 protein [Chloroflexota bacterium]|nr:glycosyltransferase family 39 protein [Chloroflexota bacterium]
MRTPPEMPTSPLRFWRDRWIASALILLAALPRLTYLGLAEFKIDEARHYQLAYQLLRGVWRWTGSTASIGFPKAPLLIYALALPLKISRDPRVATGWLGLLAALATGAFYLILRRLLSKRAAFSAGLLLAFNPQAILYARKLFTADLLLPLTTFFLGAGLAFLSVPRERAGRYAAVVAFAFALLLLTTFSPLLLLPVLIWLYWERHSELTWRQLGIAAAAFIIPCLPYLLTVAPQLPGFLSQISATSKSVLPPLSGWISSWLLGASWPVTLFTLKSLVALLLALFSLGGMLSLFQRRDDRRIRFLGAWLVLTPLAALLLPLEIQFHYLIVLLPTLYILPAAGVELACRRHDRLGWLATGLILLVALWQGTVWVHTLQDVKQGVAGYGTPLGYWWSAAQQTRALVAEQEAEEALLLLPGTQPWDEKAAVLNALLAGTPHRLVDGRHTTVYPPHRAVLLIASEVLTANQILTGTRVVAPPLPASPWGEQYHYHLWEPASQGDSFAGLQPASAKWASGSRLLGYQISGNAAPGETVQVVLGWESTSGPYPQAVHWFIHWLSQEGQTCGQVDDVGWPTSRWQPGDYIQMQFALTIAPDAPPPPYTLQVGQYTYPGLENIPIVDVAGNPAAAAVEFPLD